ncbi:PKD domain-containing protein [Glutamicibacter creatinolyticus]|uniref:PKD domain-containing protein n=1 Tax=Glutamicibacter creatinolyticus TaxID=162496 RepID=UPI0037BE224B
MSFSLALMMIIAFSAVFVVDIETERGPAKPACVESSEMIDGAHINLYGEKCPTSEDNNSSERHYTGPEIEHRQVFQENRPRQQFRIRYDETCAPGLEIPGGCDANPDLGRCEDGSFPYRQIVELVGGNNDGQVRSISLVCPEDDAAPESISREQIVEEIVVTPSQFRRFPILPSKIGSSPKQFSLRNGHTHMWAIAEIQTFDTQIFGAAVQVRAIPTHWQWNYGDGSTRSLSQPGSPSPNHTLHDKTPTSHSYLETGLFNVNLTTLYRGEFRVSGGSWQTIPGQAAVPSEAVPIDVWRTEKELIAGEGE